MIRHYGFYVFFCFFYTETTSDNLVFIVAPCNVTVRQLCYLTFYPPTPMVIFPNLGRLRRCLRWDCVSEKTWNLEMLPKHREFCFAQVVNSQILKIQDIAIFATKFSNS